MVLPCTGPTTLAPGQWTVLRVEKRGENKDKKNHQPKRKTKGTQNNRNTQKHTTHKHDKSRQPTRQNKVEGH